MTRFFLFRREEISDSSVRASDTGIGLSVFAIPASKLCFMTAVKGKINITFDQAGIYENTFLVEGESFEKTSIDIACIEGKEMELMEDILRFTTSESSKKMVMKFDVVKKQSPFDVAEVKTIEDIATKVKSSATSIATGFKSKGNKQKEYQGTIADVFFGKNLPSLDYNHKSLEGFADGASISTWSNSGLLGKTHMATKVGTINCETSFASSGVSKNSAFFTQCNHFTIPNSFTAEIDYTIYLVAGTMIRGQAPLFYGDTEGECVGFGGRVPPTADITAESLALGSSDKHSFTVRHDGRVGEPATTRTNDKKNGTASYLWSQFGEFGNTHSKSGGPEVFIIRRDKKFNMYLHNREGKVIGFIPAKTLKDNPKYTLSTPGLTDGNLLIDQIGSTGSGGGIIQTAATGITFYGYVPRFGIIESDIGTSAAATLAQDLFKLYNP